MVSKNQIKLITSLAKKKYRNQYKLFVVEGLKSIHEFLHSNFELDQVFTLNSDAFDVEEGKIFPISISDLKKISFLTNPNMALASFKIKEPKPINFNNLIVALDAVNDPGNLGTIIRLCDWFGITDLVCSLDTVDCYNPKVIQASMGSLTRVNISYLNLKLFLKEQGVAPVYGTFMQGENIYSTNLLDNGVLVLGNEANGISEEIEKLTTCKLTIPQFNSNQHTESLNVAMATAIFLSEFKRRTIEK